MTNPTDPDALRNILTNMEMLVRHAYQEGHRQGSQEVTDRLLRAAGAGADPRLPLVSTPDTGAMKDGNDGRMSPPRVGLSNAPRQYRYGAVIGMLREALINGAGVGISADQMMQYCRSRGVDVTPNVIRDTVKRLRGGEEIERRDGLYFPGQRLNGYQPAQSSARVIDLLSRTQS